MKRHLVLFAAIAIILGATIVTAQIGTFTVGGSGQANGPVYVTGSQNGGNQTNTATLTAVAVRTTYIEGLCVVVGGSTAAGSGTITISNVQGGNIIIAVESQLGAGLLPQTIIIPFYPPLPATAVNTSITVSLSALGAGNTTASASAWGFNQ